MTPGGYERNLKLGNHQISQMLVIPSIVGLLCILFGLITIGTPLNAGYVIHPLGMDQESVVIWAVDFL